jgi:methyl-accepting chemotaxis protein
MIIVATVLYIVILQYVLVHPLRELKVAAEELVSGDADLTHRLKMRSLKEVMEVTVSFNNFIEKVQHIISSIQLSKNQLENVGNELRASTFETATSITQIAADIKKINGEIAQETRSVAETASVVNEITSNIHVLEDRIQTQSTQVTEASAVSMFSCLR